MPVFPSPVVHPSRANMRVALSEKRCEQEWIGWLR